MTNTADAAAHAVAAQPKANTTCPLCGGPNSCAPAGSGSFASPCWCTTASIDSAALAALRPEAKGVACLCPRCAAGAGPRTAR